MDRMIITQIFTMARWQIVIKNSVATKQNKDQNNNKVCFIHLALYTVYITVWTKHHHLKVFAATHVVTAAKHWRADGKNIRVLKLSSTIGCTGSKLPPARFNGVGGWGWGWRVLRRKSSYANCLCFVGSLGVFSFTCYALVPFLIGKIHACARTRVYVCV